MPEIPGGKRFPACAATIAVSRSGLSASPEPRIATGKGGRRQVYRLLAAFQEQLGSNLKGIYLHGSLAMGCFNPAASDIDLLVLTSHPIPLSTKKTLVECLLSISGSPHPVEISFLSREDVNPWRYPTPFDLHYSESWRRQYGEDLATGRWQHWGEQLQNDTDLAAHTTVTRQRGVCLWGEPIEQAFPEVPHQDYLASIVCDLEWLRERLAQDSLYAVLNSCRVAAYLQERRVCSKEEGALWALNALPSEFRPMIQISLDIYRGQRMGSETIDAEMAERLIEYVLSLAKEAPQF